LFRQRRTNSLNPQRISYHAGAGKNPEQATCCACD
jgi:hypothetical protein